MKSDEFRLKNDEFRLKNDEFRLKNDDFGVQLATGVVRAVLTAGVDGILWRQQHPWRRRRQRTS